MSISLEVVYEDRRWRALGIKASILKETTASLSKQQDLKVKHNAVILFTSDARMQELNHTWRGKDKPTNVLSFANSVYLGDIALGFETVEREALEAKKPMLHHTQHLIVHGLLHLLGYDHETDEEAEKMEAHEVAILHAIAIPNPYQERT